MCTACVGRWEPSGTGRQAGLITRLPRRPPLRSGGDTGGCCRVCRERLAAASLEAFEQPLAHRGPGVVLCCSKRFLMDL